MAEAGANRKQQSVLHRVPSTPNARAKWLQPPLSPGRSVSLSPSRAQKAHKPSTMDSMIRAGSTSPLRHRQLPSASPGPMASSERRQKLKQYNTIEDAVNLIRDSSDIIVLSGAGISTSVGIPDFRSKQGLYSQVSARFADPQQLFYRENFEDDPLAFWEDVHPIVPKLMQGEILNQDGLGSRKAIEAVPRYSKVHSFFELLQSKGKLNTIFTQNIDALELAADVDADKIIACHGSWDTATCLTCDGKAKADEYLPIVLDKKLPLCSCARPQPVDPHARQSSRVKKPSQIDGEKVTYIDTKNGTISKPTARVGRKKRRAIESELAELLRKDSDDEDKFDPPAQQGLLKPDITFFGEPLNPQYFPRLKSVKDDVDLLIIIGTSLAAEPVSKLPLELPAHVPQIWISNQTTTSAKARGLRVDIELVGDADAIITELCARAGWKNALSNRLWKNHLGSNRQANATKARTISAVSEERKEKEGFVEEIAQSQTKQRTGDDGYGTVKLQNEAATSPDSKSSIAKVPETAIEVETTAQVSLKQGQPVPTSAPLPVPIVDLAVHPPQSLPSNLSAIAKKSTEPLPNVEASLSPSKSPPLPFRSGNKRPLSIGDTLVANNDAFGASKDLSTPSTISVVSQQSPSRPAKAARTASALSAVGRYDAISDPDLRIFPDEAFTNIIYFKKK